MEEANEIAKAQETLGKKLKTLFTNYKKDAHERKNEQYFLKKTAEFEAIWESIEENHKQLIKLDVPTHPYFTTSYFCQLQELLQEITKHISDSKQKFLQAAKPLAQQEALYYNPNQCQAPKNRLKEEEVRVHQMSQTLRDISTELINEQSRSRYQFLLEKLSKQWDVISEIYIELQVQEIDHTIKNPIQDLEKQYEETVQNLQDKIQGVQQTVRQCNIVLPQIKLPNFDGLYEEWVTFRDIFIKVVHENPTITTIEKMQYLKTHVRGEAGRLIQHLSIAETNYNPAWNILNDRYSNDRLIVSKLIDRILDLPVIQHESPSKIKQLHDTVVECLEAINNLKIDTSNWGPIISRIICRKWDHETNKLYEQSLSKPHEIQDFVEVRRFLQARFQSLEAMSDAQKKNPYNSNNNNDNNKPRSTDACKYCNEAHLIYHCTKFKALSSELRLKAAKDKKLCLNCLNHDYKSKCNSSMKCRICNNHHHTYLHIDYDDKVTAPIREETEMQQTFY